MCPYIEDPDQECAKKLTLKHIEEALTICGDSFTDCPHYTERLECPRKAEEVHAY
jgi:hypothetical protein